MSYALRVSKLSKSFGVTRALREVSIDISVGEVVAIAGENGAGKSTLVKILSGVIPAGSYSGDVGVNGKEVQFPNVRAAEREGIFLVPQELNVVPEMSVADFLFLNREPTRKGFVDRRQLLVQTAHWLQKFGLHTSPLEKMGSLSSHEQQLVTIARALTQGVKILILDEPTASLTGRETDLLFEQILALKKMAVTILYISHRLAEFSRIVDSVVVMRDGTVVDRFSDLANEPIAQRVVRTMVGRDLNDLYEKVSAPKGDTVVQLLGWSVGSRDGRQRDPVQNVDLDVKRGEVVGIFGLIGCGSTELARSMFGSATGRVQGTALIHGEAVKLGNPRQALNAGIAYLPADRKQDGLILEMSITKNLTLAALDKFEKRGVVSRHQEMQVAQEQVRGLRVKCASIEQPIGDLSGGNQQKVVAAKWALTQPSIVILEEPTRGVDVGARMEIYKLINSMVLEGKGVLLISTDLPEVIGMSDRVIAMHDGRFVGSWERQQANEKVIMMRAAGTSMELAQ